MQVFTSVLVLGIVFTVFIITDITAYKQRKVDSMISLAQVIGTNSISTLQFEDEDAAKQILSELDNVAPEISSAGIVDKNGKIFASYAKGGKDKFHIPEGVDHDNYLFTGNQLFIKNPIISNNEVIGNVFLVGVLSELQQVKHNMYELAILLLFVALIFSFLIANAIQTYISKRLLYLVNTMKEVSKSANYEKMLADDGKDEIGILINVFNNLMQQVKESQRRKDEFIGVASHELKTPLTTIKGYMELLNVMEDQQPKKQFVHKALDNVKKLEGLIKDLLDVSKIQSGQLELTMQEFNVNVFLDETIAAVQMVSVTHRIVRTGISDDKMILADRQRIEQVLVNLLSNAIKYSPGEKKVIVDSILSDDELIIKIRDFGIGIPVEEQLNIFERFYRTKSISVHISGFGLGLYICRDIIQRHHGRIWVEAEEKGSAFYFSLPLKTFSNDTTN